MQPRSVGVPGVCTLVIVLLGLALRAGAAYADAPAEIRRLAGTEGIVYVVDEAERVLVDVGGQRSFLPASTLKVFTTLLAAEYLGLEKRFRTEVFLQHGQLIVRGFGDPFLVSEELDRIAEALAPLLAGTSVEGIAIDESFFEPGLRIPGADVSDYAFDAPNAALAVNFNTIAFIREGARIAPAEAQTPLTALARELAQQHGGSGTVRISLGTHPEDTARYAGELLAAKLRAHGIAVGAQVEVRRAPAEPPLYVHFNSRTVADVCREMLYYSNNYVANQVFLTIGAMVSGPPASVHKSVAVAEQYLAAHPDLSDIRLAEGAGLSYDDRITPRAMAALLKRFAPYRGLLRDTDRASYKTGTLRVTQVLVGYLDTRTHGTVRFVVSLDGTRESRRWEILERLRHWL